MFDKTIARSLFVVALLFCAVSAQADVFNMPSGQTSLQFVTVGNPGNAPDTTVMNDGTTGYGSVPYVYQMGKYDVTTAQYTAFLNAVAAAGDPYGLYYPKMAVVGGSAFGCGIVQGGAAGSYTYTVVPAYENLPVNCITWGDAARFCNWLQNGQPTGVEGDATTEKGAYTLSGGTSNAALMAVTRNANASYFIPSENEWYKAAYFDPTLSGGAGGYWTYPTKNNSAPSNVLSATGTNNANFANNGYTDPTNYLTPVGSFELSPGPFGTYDMGGNVWQWNEADISSSWRGQHGGSYYRTSDTLASSYRNYDDPTHAGLRNGFRVASSEVVPEPGSIAMLLAGAVAFGIWRLRRNASPLRPFTL